MNILIITSSYPLNPNDPTEAAGVFVRDFALELKNQGHNVIVQPVKKDNNYIADEGLTIEPLPWLGGKKALASVNMFNPKNWFIFLHFFYKGRKKAIITAKKYRIDRVFALWLIPSGIFASYIFKKTKIPYDLWALGSDIWKISKIPVLGKFVLKYIAKNASNIFADGLQLSDDVKKFTKRKCEFLPSCRQLPKPNNDFKKLKPNGVTHLLYVGRYHFNKGPDILIEAISLLDEKAKSSIHIHMFGLGPMKKQLKNMIKIYKLVNTITLNGPINAQTFSNYLKQVSFLVIPSRIESIPVVFSDAIQMGTPVISTPVGDLKELIEKNNLGIVAKSLNAKGIKESLERVLKKDENIKLDFNKLHIYSPEISVKNFLKNI